MDNNQIKMTSFDSPYRIHNILYIVSTDIKGTLSMGMVPGRKDKQWNRDLDTDLNTLMEYGIDVIICLIEWSEMHKIGIIDYPLQAQNYGLVFYHMPIRDTGHPKLKELHILVSLIYDHLVKGNHVHIHCKEGLGRAGTIAACCLGYLGYNGNDAISSIRSLRPKAIQTPDQEKCIIEYCDNLSVIQPV